MALVLVAALSSVSAAAAPQISVDKATNDKCVAGIYTCDYPQMYGRAQCKRNQEFTTQSGLVKCKCQAYQVCKATEYKDAQGWHKIIESGAKPSGSASPTGGASGAGSGLSDAPTATEPAVTSDIPRQPTLGEEQTDGSVAPTKPADAATAIENIAGGEDNKATEEAQPRTPLQKFMDRITDALSPSSANATPRTETDTTGFDADEAQRGGAVSNDTFGPPTTERSPITDEQREQKAREMFPNYFENLPVGSEQRARTLDMAEAQIREDQALAQRQADSARYLEEARAANRQRETDAYNSTITGRVANLTSAIARNVKYSWESLKNAPAEIGQLFSEVRESFTWGNPESSGLDASTAGSAEAPATLPDVSDFAETGSGGNVLSISAEEYAENVAREDYDRGWAMWDAQFNAEMDARMAQLDARIEAAFPAGGTPPSAESNIDWNAINTEAWEDSFADWAAQNEGERGVDVNQVDETETQIAGQPGVTSESETDTGPRFTADGREIVSIERMQQMQDAVLAEGIQAINSQNEDEIKAAQQKLEDLGKKYQVAEIPTSPRTGVDTAQIEATQQKFQREMAAIEEEKQRAAEVFEQARLARQISDAVPTPEAAPVDLTMSHEEQIRALEDLMKNERIAAAPTETSNAQAFLDDQFADPQNPQIAQNDSDRSDVADQSQSNQDLPRVDGLSPEKVAECLGNSFAIGCPRISENFRQYMELYNPTLTKAYDTARNWFDNLGGSTDSIQIAQIQSEIDVGSAISTENAAEPQFPTSIPTASGGSFFDTVAERASDTWQNIETAAQRWTADVNAYMESRFGLDFGFEPPIQPTAIAEVPTEIGGTSVQAEPQVPTEPYRVASVGNDIPAPQAPIVTDTNAAPSTDINTGTVAQTNAQASRTPGDVGYRGGSVVDYLERAKQAGFNVESSPQWRAARAAELGISGYSRSGGTSAQNTRLLRMLRGF